MKNSGTIRVGIGGWTFEPWRGELLPGGAAAGARSSRTRAAHLHLDRDQRHLLPHAEARRPSPSGRARRRTDFVFSVKGPRFAVNRRVLAEAGDSIKRFLDSGVLELGDKLGPDAVAVRADQEIRRGGFRRLPGAAAGQGRRAHAAPRGRGAPRLVLRAGLHRAAAQVRRRRSSSPSTRHIPAIADVVGDFVYARLQKGNDAIEDRLSAEAARRLGQARPSLGRGRRARRPDHADPEPAKPSRRRATCSSTSSTRARCAPRRRDGPDRAASTKPKRTPHPVRHARHVGPTSPSGRGGSARAALAEPHLSQGERSRARRQPRERVRGRPPLRLHA